MNGVNRAIRTRYKGILFRSKLEADWARYFDQLVLEWQYEKEGRYFGDVFYLPDFFLPRSRQYVEVKGLWQPADCRKVGALLSHLEPRSQDGGVTDVALIAANPNGHFWGYRRPRKGEDATDLNTLLLELCIKVTLANCLKCRGWWFMDEDMGWRCQCCGAYDGHRFLYDVLQSPAPGWPDQYTRAA